MILMIVKFQGVPGNFVDIGKNDEKSKIGTYCIPYIHSTGKRSISLLGVWISISYLLAIID